MSPSHWLTQVHTHKCIFWSLNVLPFLSHLSKWWVRLLAVWLWSRVLQCQFSPDCVLIVRQAAPLAMAWSNLERSERSNICLQRWLYNFSGLVQLSFNVLQALLPLGSAHVQYIRVHYFSSDASRAFERAVHEADQLGCDGLLIDLRNNPGMQQAQHW